MESVSCCLTQGIIFYRDCVYKHLNSNTQTATYTYLFSDISALLQFFVTLNFSLTSHKMSLLSCRLNLGSDMLSYIILKIRGIL